MQLKAQFRTLKHTVLSVVQDVTHPSKQQSIHTREQLYYTFTKDGELIAIDENGQVLDPTA